VTLSINGDTTCSNASPGDVIRVQLTCRAHRHINHLSFGIRIRNKEGVKVYSGGTLAADLGAAHAAPGSVGTWHREFAAGEQVTVDMSFECKLGEGFYEIQAYVCEEQMFMPGFQRMLHWRDEAAFFTVAIDRLKRWFGGICDVDIKYEIH
jgi:lipopolysaccharide transport system ATP-binding protein